MTIGYKHVNVSKLTGRTDGIVELTDYLGAPRKAGELRKTRDC